MLDRLVLGEACRSMGGAPPPRRRGRSRSGVRRCIAWWMRLRSRGGCRNDHSSRGAVVTTIGTSASRNLHGKKKKNYGRFAADDSTVSGAVATIPSETRFSSPADAVSISRGAKGSTSPRDRTSTTTHAFRSSHFRRFWPAAGDYAARPEASGASWRHSETVGHRATLRFGPRSSVDRAAVS